MSQQFSPSQLRAARALLDWSRAELASQTGVSEPTIHRLENGMGKPEVKTQAKIRRVLEDSGIEFIGNSGAQIKQHAVNVLEGVEGFKRLVDDVYASACDPSASDGSKPICIGNVDERLFMKFLGDYMTFHRTRMSELKKVKVRILISEQDYYTFPENYILYRWGPKQKASNVPFYVYADKLAVLMLDESQDVQIVIIQSALVAKAYREQFEMLWALSKEIPQKKMTKQ